MNKYSAIRIGNALIRDYAQVRAWVTRAGGAYCVNYFDDLTGYTNIIFHADDVARHRTEISERRAKYHADMVR